MHWRRLVGVFAAVIATLALAAPASAHGDHDARPLARQVAAGPYSVSLWQVYPDAGSAMTPHLIVMLDGSAATAVPRIAVAVNSISTEVHPSTTTSNGWETTDGLDVGDVVTVTISDGSQAWELDPVVVPPAPTSMLPMEELIYASIFLTACTTVWVARRFTRTWRRPAATAT